MKNNTVKGIRLLYDNYELREDVEFMREMVDICPTNYLLCLGKACLSPHMTEKGIKVLIKNPNFKEIFEKGPRILLASEKNNKDKFIEKYTIEEQEKMNENYKDTFDMTLLAMILYDKYFMVEYAKFLKKVDENPELKEEKEFTNIIASKMKQLIEEYNQYIKDINGKSKNTGDLRENIKKIKRMRILAEVAQYIDINNSLHDVMQFGKFIHGKIDKDVLLYLEKEKLYSNEKNEGKEKTNKPKDSPDKEMDEEEIIKKAKKILQDENPEDNYDFPKKR